MTVRQCDAWPGQRSPQGAQHGAPPCAFGTDARAPARRHPPGQVTPPTPRRRPKTQARSQELL
eukprot:3225783-Alexandrium_andersonii.AAC.1